MCLDHGAISRAVAAAAALKFMFRHMRVAVLDELDDVAESDVTREAPVRRLGAVLAKVRHVFVVRVAHMAALSALKVAAQLRPFYRFRQFVRRVFVDVHLLFSQINLY